MTIKDLQIKQAELDAFIIKHLDLKLSESEMLKNMILACHDEISVVEEAPDDVEEWIDVLHFLLSIANKKAFVLVTPEKYHDSVTDKSCVGYLWSDLLYFTRLSRCFKHWSAKVPSEDDITVMENFIQGSINAIYTKCLRSDTCMFKEYEKKYQINIKRQEDGGY